ncbi:MAG TPA: hypothetical protein VK465_08655, partial [Fibrobacteria bacterium]|nr:hypothetical protein [Fibrobacteria bacterium]
MKYLIINLMFASTLLAQEMRWVDFDNGYPVNNAGAPYPGQYFSSIGGGPGRYNLDSTVRIGNSGASLRIDQDSLQLYLQFNSHNANGTRGFTREYVSNPAGWQFNTYNRLEFWVWVPLNAPPHRTTGSQAAYNIGTYVKRVENADNSSDETGGNHYYHFLNLPALGHWSKVSMNTHPSHQRGGAGSTEWGNMPHPTGEATFNYFDAMTRLYFNGVAGQNPPYPQTYRLDEMVFKKTADTLADEYVYSISATYVPASDRLVLSWCKRKDNQNNHQVRWSRSPITSWEALTPWATAKPRSSGGYNGMLLDTTGMGWAVGDTVYIAIKQDGTTAYATLTLPILDANGSPGLPPPQPRDTVVVRDTVY